MRSLFIFFTVLGFVSLAGGAGLHYVIDRSSSTPSVALQSAQRGESASAIEVFTPPANLKHCGEATLSRSGKLDNQKAFDCFSENLLNCSPAEFIAIADGGNIKYQRIITERRGDRCLVHESYLSVAKTDLIGKGITCEYNPLLPLSQEINYRECTGSLRDEIFNNAQF